MLKKVSVILFAMLLCACVSEPAQNGLKKSGDFDTDEAAKTRVSLGLTYLKNGNFSQAKFNLDKALEFAPRSGQANFAMAFYYQQVDEVQRAHEYYQQAISLSNDDPDILNSYGAFLCKQGNYEQAKKHFLKSVGDKSYISTASTYENLAICSENQGKIEEAITYFDSALNHQPTRASSLLYISQLYVQTEQWEEAKRSLWKYERNASVTSESLWLSFQIARGLKDLKASVEYAEILKRLYPNDPNTQKVINELGKFQPDMAVTQKNRDSFQGLPTINTATDANQQSAQLDTLDDKSTLLLAPVIETPSPAASLDPDMQLAVEEVAEIPIAVPNKENETESALKNALDNTEALSQSTANTTTFEAINEANDPVDAMPTEVADEIPDTTVNAETLSHIVKPKDNLYRISLKYNVKIKKLLEWNDLTDSSSISIGTKLWVRDPNLNE